MYISQRVEISDETVDTYHYISPVNMSTGSEHHLHLLHHGGAGVPQQLRHVLPGGQGEGGGGGAQLLHSHLHLLHTAQGVSSKLFKREIYQIN